MERRAGAGVKTTDVVAQPLATGTGGRAQERHAFLFLSGPVAVVYQACGSVAASPGAQLLPVRNADLKAIMASCAAV